MGPVVLTVLPDHPIPASTGLHLRMVANLEMVHRVAAESHVLWFATEDRPPDWGRPIPGVTSAVCAGPRVEQHQMSGVGRAAAKVSFAANGVVGRVARRYPFSMRYDAVDAAARIKDRAREVGADWVLLPSQVPAWVHASSQYMPTPGS